MSKKLSTSSSDDEGAEEQPAIKPAPADDEEDALSEDERHQVRLPKQENPRTISSV